MYSMIVAVVLAFLSVGTVVVKADVAARDISCNFGKDYCGWTNDTTMTNGEFLREFNTTKDRVIPTNCYFIIATPSAGESGNSKLDSPQFMVKDATVVLQVNFSYWLKNTRATQLKLFVVPLEGVQNGTTRLVWETKADQKSAELWNATNVNIKDLFQAKKFKLSLQGITNAFDDVAAVERIVVTELSAAAVPNFDKLPNVTYVMEKAEENPNLCSRSSEVYNNIVLLSLSVFALLFVFHRF